jgi:dTDP-4-amino-4,6-dideoxygalactose transaminase
LSKKVIASGIKNLLSNRVIFDFFIFPIFKASNLNGNSNFDRFVGKRPTSPISTLPREWFTRYSSIQAKFGLKVLKSINERDMLRIQVARKYINANKSVSFITGSQNGKHIYWQCIALVEDVDKFRRYMYHKGIDTALSSLIEISQLPEYGINSTTPNADLIYKKGVYLPCYHHLNQNEVERVSKALADYS